MLNTVSCIFVVFPQFLRKIRKSRLPELMFSGHITIQYMFYIIFMIKKNILERFNDRGGAIDKSKRGKTSKTQKIDQNLDVFWQYLDVYWTKTHHILHAGIF